MFAMALSVSLVLANSFGGRLLAPRAAAPENTGTTREEAAAVEEIAVPVPDIHCQGCVDTIAAYLEGEEGVERVEGDASSRIVRVSFDPGAVTPEQIKATIARLGYTPGPPEPLTADRTAGAEGAAIRSARPASR